MTHIYQVTGMTCNGCKSSVEKRLSSIEHIVEVNVNLENAEAEITMSAPISVQDLQNALSEKYTITKKMMATNKAMSSSMITGEVPHSELSQLFPLFLIFGYIIVASFLLNRKPWVAHGFMLDFMGLFYIVFSFFKLLDLKGFPESFKMYDPLAKVIPAYAWIYPFIEVALGLMFLMRFQISFALIITLVVLGITTVGVSKALLNKKSIQCACLGTALKLPMTKATFIENTVMIIMAVIMLLKTYN